MSEDAARAAERVARDSYGRLLAFLARRTGNIERAEDALAGAFEAALKTWPDRGVPDHPDAWLLTAAKRKFLDEQRKGERLVAPDDDFAALVEEAAPAEIADERLKLLFICAHPAIDPDVRTPLMLQTVLGLDARRIGAAFLTPPSAMAQRLVRAKRKIAAAGIPFESPASGELRSRAASVIEAVYAAFGASYDDQLGGDQDPDRLAEEALFLARLVAALLPEEAEAHGLVALICYVHARRRARRAGDGYTPFDDQATAEWDGALIAEADAALERAAALKAPGRCQLEAAIQSAHMTRRLLGRDTRGDVVKLYERLLEVAPCLGARIGRAGALLAAEKATEAVTVLRAIDPDLVRTHQPYWATLAAAEEKSGDLERALDSYGQAIGLSQDPALRQFLMEKKSAVLAEIKRNFVSPGRYAARTGSPGYERKAHTAAPERAASAGPRETAALRTPRGPKGDPKGGTQ